MARRMGAAKRTFDAEDRFEILAKGETSATNRILGPKPVRSPVKIVVRYTFQPCGLVGQFLLLRLNVFDCLRLSRICHHHLNGRREGASHPRAQEMVRCYAARVASKITGPEVVPDRRAPAHPIAQQVSAFAPGDVP
jgi:hypothetical protein